MKKNTPTILATAKTAPTEPIIINVGGGLGDFARVDCATTPAALRPTAVVFLDGEVELDNVGVVLDATVSGAAASEMVSDKNEVACVDRLLSRTVARIVSVDLEL